MQGKTLLTLLPAITQAAKIIQSNDDGWAEINIRILYQGLKASGHQALISSPAENRSGGGSIDIPPTSLTTACEFDSCPAGSPPTGNNASTPDFNYVNSFPVTSIKTGITATAPALFGTAPDLAVTGPNVGVNVGLVTLFSGTVGAATYAADRAGIPAIAFSGASGTQTAWNQPVPAYAQIYADLATNITDLVLDGGVPYLPQDTYLNVNFPDAGDGFTCTDVSQFKFVLSRILDAVPIVTGDDVEQCGSTRLPTESSVVGTAGCYVSISVGSASSKTDSTEANQAIVRDRLASSLSCLPNSFQTQQETQTGRKIDSRAM